MNETLQERLQAAQQAAERLAPIKADEELARQKPAIESEIRRQQELAELRPLAVQQEAQTVDMVREAIADVTAYRERVAEEIRRLDQLPKDLSAAQAGIYLAGRMAVSAARTSARIAELEGRKADVLSELESLWTKAGGRSKDLAALPESTPEDIVKRFRGQPRYMPHLGSQNIIY